MLTRSCSTFMPGTGKGRISLGGLFLEIESAPANKTKLQLLMSFMLICWEVAQLENILLI